MAKPKRSDPVDKKKKKKYKSLLDIFGSFYKGGAGSDRQKRLRDVEERATRKK